MSALIAFETAARHASFKKAAVELNVTPAAISHQVKSLEQELRITLFHRYHRGVELTELGAYLLVALQRSFEGINDALDQLRARTSKAAVTIRVTTAVSSLWLMPRLAEFWRTHGHVSVAQIVNDTDQDHNDCDLSIHYADMSKDKGDCRVLFHDRIAALCSPRFAAAHAIQSIGELAKLPLIHMEAGNTGWTSWKDWFASLGYTGPIRVDHRVNNYLIALQAAQDDMGVVLGWDGLTHELVSSGRLVPLLPIDISSPQDFYVKLHSQASKPAQQLFNWLGQ